MKQAWQIYFWLTFLLIAACFIAKATPRYNMGGDISVDGKPLFRIYYALPNNSDDAWDTPRFASFHEIEPLGLEGKDEIKLESKLDPSSKGVLLSAHHAGSIKLQHLTLRRTESNQWRIDTEEFDHFFFNRLVSRRLARHVR